MIKKNKNRSVKCKWKKSDIEVLMTVRSPKILWHYGVPRKGSAEYGLEYCYFGFQFKDKRRVGMQIYIDKGEVRDLIRFFKLAKKYYKKHGEPKWQGNPARWIEDGIHKSLKDAEKDI